MKKVIYTILAVMGLSLASCAFEEGSPFDKSSAERMQETIDNAKAVLTDAPAGWVMQIFPEATCAYGGFNFLASFTKDGEVTIASEYSEYEQSTSTYKIDMSAGAVLSFDTYNEIFHYLSDPSVSAGEGQGYGFEGDYDYLIISAKADEVVLKGKKSGNYAYLYPLPVGADWDEALDDLVAMEEAVCAFSSRTLTIGENTFPVSISYHRFKVDAVIDGVQMSVNLPFVVTFDGIKLYQPVELCGAVLDEFIFDDDDLISTDDENVVMAPVIKPLNEAFATGEWFISKANMGGEMASNIQTFVDMVYQGEGETVIYLGFCVGNHVMTALSSNWGLFMYVDAGYSAFWHFNATYSEDEPNKISLIYAEAGEKDYSYYMNHYGSTHLSAFGYAAAHTFVLTADNLKAPSTITLTEEGKPENYVTFVNGTVQY